MSEVGFEPKPGDPVHAGDKALTRETPAQRGGLTGTLYAM